MARVSDYKAFIFGYSPINGAVRKKLNEAIVWSIPFILRVTNFLYLSKLLEIVFNILLREGVIGVGDKKGSRLEFVC